MKKLWNLSCGLGVMVMGLTSLTLAKGAVPSGERGMRVTDDTAIYQRLSEIKAPREGRLNFDSDLDRLAGLEHRYREKLPSLAKDPRIGSPMKRISSQQYRYSGGQAQKTVRN